MSKRTIIIGILVLIAAGAAALLWYSEQREALPSPTPTPLVGGDRDEHGCIGSAGYSWCAPKNKCLRIWEEACYTSSTQEVQYILAEKYDKSVADVVIRVTKQSGNFIAGSVSFAAPGLPTPGEGGAFLAVKEGNAWQVVYDGNGSVDCNAMKNTYHFPADVLVGFCD